MRVSIGWPASLFTARLHAAADASRVMPRSGRHKRGVAGKRMVKKEKKKEKTQRSTLVLCLP